MKRLATILANLAIVIVAVLAVAIILLPIAFGARPLAVLSGSMVPTLQVGGVALMERVDPTTVKVGDIITFKAPADSKVMITHRVIEVITEPALAFRTQGDAVGVPDPSPVPAERVMGKVRYSVPAIGYIMQKTAKAIRTPLGFGLTMGVTSILLLGSEVRDILSSQSPSGRRARLRKRRAERLKKRWPRAARRLI